MSIVQLRVTAALSVAVLVLTQLPFERLIALEMFGKVLLFLGLAAMVLASVFYFAYSAAMHHSRTELATCLLELDVDQAGKVGGFKGGVALENVWYFHVGNVLFLLGGISLTGVVGLVLI